MKKKSLTFAFGGCCRKELFGSNIDRMHEEGLNTLQYKVVKRNHTNVAMWMMVDPYKPNGTEIADAQAAAGPAIITPSPE